jgi:ubiquinone/menaquinone biosynthesis C-methylase UbiE
MTEALQPYAPAKPLPELVAELNKLYHEFEAHRYQTTHPEIFEQLPRLWREMIAEVNAPGPLRILDFGCGTGFEARQCLESFGARIERMVCYDSSEEMLDRCRQALAPWRDTVEYVTSLDRLSARDGSFNLLVSNSVLHHVVDPVRAIREFEPLLSPTAIWLCGHEPSRRFLMNPACRAVLQRYRGRDRWQRFLSPRRFTRWFLRWTGLAELPQDYAARRAFELSMFQKRPPAHLVSQLVDFHVVTSESQLGEARGLDFRSLETVFSSEWDLTWHRTYAFLGPYHSDALSSRWQREARRLAEKYPDDGANCCSVWRKRATP